MGVEDIDTAMGRTMNGQKHYAYDSRGFYSLLQKPHDEANICDEGTGHANAEP